jgi:glycine cleavage system protein P-like pyridoxal-binding family
MEPIECSFGNVKPGKIGFDLMHFNLHKTFATPMEEVAQSGPVAVTKIATFFAGYYSSESRMWLSSFL